jgi:hypothetical protein
MIETVMAYDSWDTPGRGRKQCIKCKKYVGLRVKICNCGHEFSSSDKLVKEISAEQKDLIMYCESLGKTSRDRVVYTPTDYPEIVPTEITLNGVYDWADKVIDHGKDHLKIYTIEALKYIWGKQVGYHTDDYVQGCKFLIQWKDSLL